MKTARKTQILALGLYVLAVALVLPILYGQTIYVLVSNGIVAGDFRRYVEYPFGPGGATTIFLTIAFALACAIAAYLLGTRSPSRVSAGGEIAP